jgi:hypothetical protein
MWQEDYFDRYIRDVVHYEATLRYVILNPVKAGLVKNVANYEWWDAPSRGTGPGPK